MSDYDVVVVGAGNAALSAAMAARENGARVLILERLQKKRRAATPTSPRVDSDSAIRALMMWQPMC